MPSSEARKALADLMSMPQLIRGSAVIMEGTGFRAAAVRRVVTGFALLSHHEFPHRICNVEGAVRMYTDAMPGVTGRAWDPNKIRAGIDELKRLEVGERSRGSHHSRGSNYIIAALDSC
jgi:hypothetical protein